ncbi:MAG: type II secretion system F family protein [Chthoniobacterales bacterium]
MAEFFYLAKRDGEQKIRKGVVDMPSLQDFETAALDQRLALLKVWRKREAFEGRLSRAKIPVKIKINFFQQMATCYKLGVHLTRALDIIRDSCPHKTFQKILSNIEKEIQHGSKIHVCLARYPKIFDDVTLSLIAVGEEAGAMEKVCRQIKALMVRNQKVRKKVTSIMIYPAIVCLTLTVSLYILTTQVIPKFATIFQSAHLSLPVPTQILMAVSGIATANPLLTLLAVGGFLYAVIQFPRIFNHFYQLHRFSLRLPVIGAIQRTVITANFARTFSNLIDAQVDLIRALSLVKEISTNFCYKAMISNAILAVNEGRKMAPLLNDADVFKKDFIKLLEFVDQTGQISTALVPAADELDEELNTLVDELKPVIESIIIVLIGLVLGGVLLALFLPIFNISEAIRAQSG